MDKEKRVSEKRAAQSRKEDAALNRVLIWFGAAVVAELILLLLNRYYINATTRPGEIEFQGALLAAFPTILGVTAGGFVWCGCCSGAGVGKTLCFPDVSPWRLVS